MKNGFKLVLITLPIAAIGAGVLAFLVLNSPPPARVDIAERATAVRAIIAQSQPTRPTVTGFGLVSPARVYEAISQVAGSVDYVNPELSKGGILPAGAVLLRLSPEDYTLAIAQARANIRAAEAKLNELAISEKNQRAALALETEALALKAADLERTQALFDSGTVPQSRLDAAQTALLGQQQKVLSIESAIALFPTQGDVQRQQIAVYQASLDSAELNLARTELTLPFTARVASVAVEQGQFVRSGQTTAVLDGIDRAEVEAQVSISALRKVLQATQPDAAIFAADPALMTEVLRGLDLTAEVSLSLGEDRVTWPAQVDRISETVDPKTGMIGIILRVESAYSGARPGERPPLTKGMFVEATLSAAPVTGIVVPRNALRDGQVLVAGEDDRLALVAVTPGLVQGDIVVLSDAIAPGTRVVVSDPSPAIPGMLLEVVQDTGLMARLAGAGQAR